jgi:hypothetical protein
MGMAASTLAHITLDTGHTRASPRSEVQDEIIALPKPIISFRKPRP